MPRIARVVVPDCPHHVTQRGNRRQRTFFEDDDYVRYKELLAQGCKQAGVEVWAYCLMPNHVHLVLVPSDPITGICTLSEAHRRYTRLINERKGWTGYLWQGRFASVAMDESHLMACVRYVEQNPVRAKLVTRARDWPWSSARAHLAGRDDGLVRVKPLLAHVDDWSAYLGEKLGSGELEAIRAGERTGRPLASISFLKQIEKRLGRKLTKQKPGPKPKQHGGLG